MRCENWVLYVWIVSRRSSLWLQASLEAFAWPLLSCWPGTILLCGNYICKVDLPQSKQRTPWNSFSPKLPFHHSFVFPVFFLSLHQPVVLFWLSHFAFSNEYILQTGDISLSLSLSVSSLLISFFLKRQMVSERSHPQLAGREPADRPKWEVVNYQYSSAQVK